MFRTRLFLLALIASLTLGLSSLPVYGQKTATSGAHAATQHKQLARAAELSEKLKALDDDAKVAFNEHHPGILPENKLHLPPATVAAFDWAALDKVSAPHHQLTGDCWANAATEALECSNLIRNDRRISLSPQPVLDHLKLGADKMGSQPYRAYDFFLRTGTASLSSYAYTGVPSQPLDVPLNYRAVAWGRVCPDNSMPTTEQLKQALLEHGPLAVSLLATPKVHAYKGGVFEEKNPPNPDHKESNHTVLLTGWDDNQGAHGAWRIRNSWKSNWGEQGWMWIAYDSNNVGVHAVWVDAQSTFYSVPAADLAVLLPDAKPFPRFRNPLKLAKQP